MLRIVSSRQNSMKLYTLAANVFVEGKKEAKREDKSLRVST